MAVDNNGGYFSSKMFDSPPCGGVDWWMKFENGPVQLTGISFGEGPGMGGGEFVFWGFCDIVDDNCNQGKTNIEILCLGKAERLSKSANSLGKSFNIYGLSSRNCVTDIPPEYYWSIRDFKFTVK